MSTDSDIDQMLCRIEQGLHPVQTTAEEFIGSLPGYCNSSHSSLTVQKYRGCLLTDKRSFLAYTRQAGLAAIEDVENEHLEKYKDKLLNELDPQTVRGYTTAVRQLLFYAARMGWIARELAERFRLPKRLRRREIRTIPEEVQQAVLGGEWGNNGFTITRNRLLVRLFLRDGLHPKEIPSLREEHIHPYNELAYLVVYGKKNVPRNVMLDEQSLSALRNYMVERAHHMRSQHIQDDHVVLSLVPHNGRWGITTSGVQAVVRRIKAELRLLGCVWDLSALNAQGCRRSAVSHDYEAAESMPICHPELTLAGKYGHSVEVAQKFYWRRSLKNAYRMAKGIGEAAQRLEVSGPSEDGQRGNAESTGRSFLDTALGI